jgi:tRNA(fMet)-specific endonuclease VapC
MRYLLDTNIIAEPTKPQPEKRVLNLLAQCGSEAAISAITWYELWFGVERLIPSRKRQKLVTYLQDLGTMNYPNFNHAPTLSNRYEDSCQ